MLRKKNNYWHRKFNAAVSDSTAHKVKPIKTLFALIATLLLFVTYPVSANTHKTMSTKSKQHKHVTHTTQRTHTTHHAKKTLSKTHHKTNHLHHAHVIHGERVNSELAAELPNIDTNETASSQSTSRSSSVNHALAPFNLGAISEEKPHINFVTAVENRLIGFVHKTVANLHYSSYKLGGTRFDTSHGVYVLDCSNFVDHVLQEVYPSAYSDLVNSTGADNPASSHYYHFFNALSAAQGQEQYWNAVADIEQLRPGDVLVFRYKNSRGAQTGGHVMVVMDKPVQVSDVFFVRIADSAPSGHSEDTRQRHKSGIGIGTLLLKANPKTGRPAAFAWGAGGYWNKNVNFAMARPVEMDGGINQV
ncbi:MAG: hypothetical protein ABI597_06095 [Gammaproteobacteria bacterium]